MVSHITILRGDKNLTKIYSIVDGVPQKGEVRPPYMFWSKTVEAGSLDDLFNVISEASKDPFKTLIRGKGKQPTQFDIRRTKNDEFKQGYFSDYPTSWICIDFDEQETPCKRLSMEAVEWLIENHLPEQFRDVSYIFQWSNSAGLEYNSIPVKRGTNIHLFFWLDRGLVESEYKSWFRDYTEVDHALFRTVQPIYVCNRVTKPDEIIDRIDAAQKMGIVRKSEDVVKVPLIQKLQKTKALSQQVTLADSEASSEIIQQLNITGCIARKYQRTLNLFHRNEKTKGGWYVFINNPLFVHHPKHKVMHVEKWLEQFWGVEFKVTKKEQPTLVNHSEEQAVFVEEVVNGPLIEIHEPNIVNPYDVKKRSEMLRKKFGSLKKDVTLIYAPEGFGKSSLAVVWATRKTKVIFSCKTNANAVEQAERFINEGCRVQIVTSQVYNLKEYYDIEAVENDPTNPWESERVNKKATKARIKQKVGCDDAEVERIWEETSAEEPDFETHDIIVTTHTRAHLWGTLNLLNAAKRAEGKGGLSIPPGTHVVFDDPSYSDFSILTPYDEKFANCKIDGEPIQIREIEGHVYFVKPEKYRYGYGFTRANKMKLIFTTTEVVTSHFIQERFKGIDVPNLMPDKQLDAGNITVLATGLVRSNYDGFLSPMVERWKKEKYEFEYIADGQGAKNNLTNNKGRNDLKDKNVVIEISQPPLNTVDKLCHEIGWDKSSRPAMKLAIMLDQAHQAAGRNSGYRWSDRSWKDRKDCYILVDPLYFNKFCEMFRYYVSYKEKIVGEHVRSPRKDEVDFLKTIIWYLKNYKRYVLDGQDKFRKFVFDVKDAVQAAPEGPKREQRRTRISKAIGKLIEEQYGDQEAVDVPVFLIELLAELQN